MLAIWIALAGVGLCLFLIAVLAWVGRRVKAGVIGRIHALETTMIGLQPRQVMEAELPHTTHPETPKLPATLRPAEAELLSKVSAATLTS